MKKLSLILASLLAILSVNSISIRNSAVNFQLEWGLEMAEAQRRGGGGRSRGGSFSRPSRTSPSRSRGSGGSTGGRSPSRTPSRTTPRSTPAPAPAPAPGGGSTGGRTRGGSFNTPAPAPTPDSRPRTTPAPAPVPERSTPRAESSPREYQPRVERSRSFFFIPIPLGGGGRSAPVNPTAQSEQPLSGSEVQGEEQTAQQAQTASQQRQSNGSGRILLLLLLLLGAGVLMWWFLRRRSAGAGSADQLTVTKLQVGLLAQAHELQAQLTELSVEADLNSAEGLKAFLQECSLSLLSHPDYWTHVQGESQAYPDAEEAEKAFDQFSIQERSKFGEETFSNVGGRVRQRSLSQDEELDPGEYIVVTFLVATQGNEPLFESISAPDELQTVLQKLAAVPTNSLLVFELLWTPQSQTDSLTADDLLSHYPDLVIL
ncbi:DUF1517 domain-containing protein [Geitlerinema sp. P-1104]|uniref:DUF1517 domain-containing protein n=1 Tax=Geitlerinema sp. P-1104 TaxID=2546230 RepID=UPI001476D8FE|nr:DUF1517 domain-containing protein [Geitlerinema sp. P-1104]NMG58716.1 DUF1517 domain-containing protein [Geitlerinema sp. P-1104]